MSFSFIHLTDHHLRESDDLLSRGFSTGYAFNTVLRHIAAHGAHGAEFLITTGDLVDQGTEADYQSVCRRMGLALDAAAPPGPHWMSLDGLARLPVYFLPGNHDPRPAFFHNLFPSAPVRDYNLAFWHKGVQFLCLDWGSGLQAVAQPAMLDFVRQSLAGDAPTIILSHYAVVPVGVTWLDAFLSPDYRKFWDVVRGHNVLGIFTGHLHATYERVIENIPVFGLRATAYQFALVEEKLVCLQPPHYRLVTVERDRLHTEIFEVPL